TTAPLWNTWPPTPRLRWLTTALHMRDAGLARVVERSPELHELTIFDGTLWNIAPLARLRRLHYLHGWQALLTDPAIDVLLTVPQVDELFIDGPDRAGIERVAQRGPPLTRLFLRFQNISGLSSSDDWAAAAKLPGLLELGIFANIVVDGPALER